MGGIRCDKVRARLLRKPELALGKAEDMCRAAEITEVQMKLMNEEGSDTVSAIKKKEGTGDRSHRKNVKK